MTTSTGALAPLVDALVAMPLEGVEVAELQRRVAVVAPQVARPEGWLQVVAGHVMAASGGEVSRPDGSAQTVAGWLAEVRRSAPSAAGRQVRTSTALRSLPLVAEAVLDGVLTPELAAVLSRLVGRIDGASLQESQPQLIEVAAGMDPAELAMWVRHQIATHCEPALEDEAQRGRDRRFLQTSREADGTLRGRFVAAEDAESLLTVLEPLARRDGRGDARSAGQRRRPRSRPARTPQSSSWSPTCCGATVQGKSLRSRSRAKTAGPPARPTADASSMSRSRSPATRCCPRCWPKSRLRSGPSRTRNRTRRASAAVSGRGRFRPCCAACVKAGC